MWWYCSRCFDKISILQLTEVLNVELELGTTEEWETKLKKKVFGSINNEILLEMGFCVRWILSIFVIYPRRLDVLWFSNNLVSSGVSSFCLNSIFSVFCARIFYKFSITIIIMTFFFNLPTAYQVWKNSLEILFAWFMMANFCWNLNDKYPK